MYPEYIELGNKKYKINTDYRVALACFKAINDDSISDIERELAVVTLLIEEDVPFELMEQALEKCAIFLRCGKEENQSDDELDMDYDQDKGRIMASFRSCYQMNIAKENIHWWEFNDLIEGFKEDDILTRVRYIRSINLNDISDKKERERIRKLQKELEIKKPKTYKQKELDEYWDKILGGD